MTENSMNFTLTIKNYRCFPDEKPVDISMGKGFTAFIGANNSGKSSLSKLFYELRNLFENISRSDNNFIHAMRSDAGIVFNLAQSVHDNIEIFCNANTRDIILEISAKANLEDRYEGISPEKIILTIPRGTNTFTAKLIEDGKHIDTTKDNISIKRVGNTHIKVGEKLIYIEPYYQAFEALSKTIYIGPFRNAVNLGGHENYYDMIIGQQFISLWDNYKSGNSKAAIRAALKLTRDIKAVFRFTNLEINASTDNQTLHVIVDNKPYRLEELGSGLAQFILILANIAIKQPSWVFIDEPELNLHPSLQIDFLTTLASYATEGIIFSTHNVGLARACAERIYSFRHDENGLNEVRDFETMPSLSEFLGELSYSGYQDLGFDKVLLVEGPTEVKTVQQILRKYRKDHKIVLLPLGGSGLIKADSEHELIEIKRITQNVSALIDSERDSPDAKLPPHRQRFFETCKKVGIDCHVLERRAIENYLPDRAVKAIKGIKYHSLDSYQKLEQASPSWGKQENWCIVREMTPEELNSTDLGKFLRSL